ncbi:MAG: polymer-forming cytoskeletal protein [Gammaproteobacteria bacterium]
MFEIGKKGAPEKGAEASGWTETRPESSASNQKAGPREKAVIGPSIHIDGDLRGEEDLLIEGEVSGTVQLRSNSLTIGAQGKVRADVYANSIYVEGLMEGDLYGTERVHIRKSAQVRGNVTSPRVSLEDGAKFKGSIEMDPQAVQAATASRSSIGNARPAVAAKPAVPGKPDTTPALKTGV